MTSPMKKLAFRIAASAIALLAACGGNVVVDSTTSGTGTSTGAGAATTQSGSSGFGGTTTLPGEGSVGSGPGGASCFNLPNPATLMPCTGASSSGGCAFVYCDTASNNWEADCTGSACQCLLNGMELCTCALGSPGDICSGIPDCCFH